LAPARKVHAFLSYDTGSEIKPLFRGRLVGIPDDINQEVVRLQFTARPDDFAAQKTALASTLKALPYYDPVFISKRTSGTIRTRCWRPAASSGTSTASLAC
jgi:hypothetical protein